VKKILSDGADAIVCYNDFTAAAVIRELRRNKVRVPEDMGITGFDDSPFCTVLDPALTSVAPDSEVVAENAFKLLEQRMAGNRKNVYITVPPKLKIRESSVR
jgi:DNA-binding LacI/PurR family transcriptional regulator